MSQPSEFLDYDSSPNSKLKSLAFGFCMDKKIVYERNELVVEDLINGLKERVSTFCLIDKR